MWIMMPNEFLSIVKKKPTDTFLTVRARVKADLFHFKEKYCPSLEIGPDNAGTDYPYRGTGTPEAIAAGVAKAIQEITYSNFKNQTTVESGHARHDAHAKIWSVMYSLEDQIEMEKNGKEMFKKKGNFFQ